MPERQTPDKCRALEGGWLGRVASSGRGLPAHSTRPQSVNNPCQPKVCIMPANAPLRAGRSRVGRSADASPFSHVAPQGGNPRRTPLEAHCHTRRNQRRLRRSDRQLLYARWPFPRLRCESRQALPRPCETVPHGRSARSAERFALSLSAMQGLPRLRQCNGLPRRPWTKGAPPKAHPARRPVTPPKRRFRNPCCGMAEPTPNVRGVRRRQRAAQWPAAFADRNPNTRRVWMASNCDAMHDRHPSAPETMSGASHPQGRCPYPPVPHRLRERMANPLGRVAPFPRWTRLPLQGRSTHSGFRRRTASLSLCRAKAAFRDGLQGGGCGVEGMGRLNACNRALRAGECSHTAWRCRRTAVRSLFVHEPRSQALETCMNRVGFGRFMTVSCKKCTKRRSGLFHVKQSCMIPAWRYPALPPRMHE